MLSSGLVAYMTSALQVVQQGLDEDIGAMAAKTIEKEYLSACSHFSCGLACWVDYGMTDVDG